MRKSARTQIPPFFDNDPYICTRSAHFFCFPQLTYQRMLISYKVPVRMYNVEPDKISRIMYLIMF